jgi:hypothetical protein
VPEFYSGATDQIGCFTEGLLLRRSHEFQVTPGDKPLTARFDIVNVFDTVYELRDGSGIGVFAPQYGARRGFFAGLSQKF